MTKRKNYPKACAFRLDERDGRLWYGEHDVGPVPAAMPRGFVPAFSWQHADSGDTRRLRAAFGIGWHIKALYRCLHCDRWTVGNGFSWCSEECRLAARTRDARERRAGQARSAMVVMCVVCGAPIEAKRGTREFCSNRCRQAAYRALSAAPSMSRDL